MEMTIDEAIGIITAKGNYSYTVIENEAKDVLVDTARKYQMVRVDYENRLKADLKAILVELQMKIEDLDPNYECNTYYAAIRDCSNLIQQKINELKGDREGKNDERRSNKNNREC